MKTYALKLGSVFGFISVVTTLGVHLIVLPAASFEESVHLIFNPMYVFSRWMIIFHCLAVFISMMGVFIALNKEGNIHTKLGIVCFSIFSWAEITRMFLSLTYLFGLRKSYLTETDSLMKSVIKLDIVNFSGIGNGLFLVFVLGFALGNLFYGIEFLKKTGLPRLIGLALVIWFFTGMLSLYTEFNESEMISSFFGVFNISFQPLTRALVAYWLMKEATMVPVIKLER
jgi:hypothetical protein